MFVRNMNEIEKWSVVGKNIFILYSRNWWIINKYINILKNIFYGIYFFPSLDAATLNLGLHYANADNFVRRLILMGEKENNADAGKTSLREQEQERILCDADKLCTFCERQLN